MHLLAVNEIAKAVFLLAEANHYSHASSDPYLKNFLDSVLY